MTKEELEKEAEEKYVEVDREFIDCQDEGEIFNLGYLAGAEPREKQITGLSKHILELQKDKGNLIDRCKELEQQNNWLEGCKSELGEHLGKANDRIAVLEKRCANYEMTISKMEKGTCDICKEIEKDKRITELEMTVGTLRTFSNEQATCIEELEKACEETQELLDKQIEATYKLDKENAELKKDKKELCHSISEGGKACVYLNEQLTKAKDHIKKLLGCLQQDTNDPQTNYYVVKYMAEAEQFLKDSEV